jgi:hypothetical protein
MFRVAYGKDAERLPPPSAAKTENAAATAGTIRNDTFQEPPAKGGRAAGQPSAAAAHPDEEDLSVAPLGEESAINRPTEKAANGKLPTSADAGDDDDLDDFLKSIM